MKGEGKRRGEKKKEGKIMEERTKEMGRYVEKIREEKKKEGKRERRGK